MAIIEYPSRSLTLKSAVLVITSALLGFFKPVLKGPGLSFFLFFIFAVFMIGVISSTNGTKSGYKSTTDLKLSLAVIIEVVPALLLLVL